MILLLLTLSGLVWSSEPPERPKPPEAVTGQCERNYGITKGSTLPVGFVLPGGTVACSAVVVPLSDYADLLVTEDWATLVAQRYRIDTSELERERDWYKAKLEEANQPVPWMDRPTTQRWFGRVETLATVAVVAVGLGAAYQYGTGRLK